MSDVSNVLLIFDDFLAQLRRQGFEIGVDHYLRLQELLSKVSGTCRPQDLKTILCPIFARSKPQQEQFYRAFDNYFIQFDPVAPGVLSSSTIEATSIVPPRRLRSPRNHRWLYIFAAVGLVLLALVFIWRRTPQQAQPQMGAQNTPPAKASGEPQMPTQTIWPPQQIKTEPTLVPTPSAETEGSHSLRARVVRLAWDFFFRLRNTVSFLRDLAAVWIAIIAPLVIFLFYYQPLEGKESNLTGHRYFRFIILWATILLQPFLWMWYADSLQSWLPPKWWVRIVSDLSGVAIFASLLFFLSYRQPPSDSSNRTRPHGRLRKPALALAVSTSTVLFFYGLMEYRAALFAPAIFFLIYEWHRHKHRQLLLQKQRGKKPPFVWPIRIEAFAPRLFDSDLFYETARQMRRRLTGENYSLDIQASVAATTSSLGYPTLRYKLDTKPPEYLILIDRTSFRDHQAQLFNELSQALEREGIFVERYFYDADPRVFCNEARDGCLSLLELHSKFAGHRLLIFGAGEKLLDPVTGALASWTSIFSDWPERALLTPVPPVQWSFTQVSLASLFIVLPASLEGLLTLVTNFESLIEMDVRGWRASSTEAVPSLEDDQTELATGLRVYLGEPTFQWLCACAVYPELQWDLTLYLGLLPVMGGNLVREENLLRLIRLPWFRAGSIPDELRWLLLRELDPNREQAIRQALIELLERDPPPQETYAADAHQLNLVMQRWLSRHSRQHRRDLLAALRTTPQPEITSDYTLLRFLEAAPVSALNVYLPTRLRQAFFQNGIPAFGLKTGVRLLMVLVVIGCGFATREYARQFAYVPLSQAHARTILTLSPAIATQPSGGSCTSCHLLGTSIRNTESIDLKCAACHQTETFVATVISAHRAAGITCTLCHTEHRGEDFSPMNAALQSCTLCHTDENKRLFNGKSVHTPHGGTFGYPVNNGVWIWPGLDAEELAEKPEIVAALNQQKITSSQTQRWRNAQFHAIHDGRVHVVEGIDGVLDDAGIQSVLSCRSCHRDGYQGINIDRTYPRQTCAKCHNGYTDSRTRRQVLADDQPNCTSCHVQHVRDARWNPSLLSSNLNTTGNLPTSTREQLTPAANATLDYSKFSHLSPREHAVLSGPGNCSSCHHQNSSLVPSFPTHGDCIACHLVQFTESTSVAKPLCLICHTNAESVNPPTKNFPHLQSFSTKFDHGRHNMGAARPANGCVACHQMSGNNVLSTVLGLNAHAACYACHVVGKQSDASCDVCHTFGIEPAK